MSIMGTLQSDGFPKKDVPEATWESGKQSLDRPGAGRGFGTNFVPRAPARNKICSERGARNNGTVAQKRCSEQFLFRPPPARNKICSERLPGPPFGPPSGPHPGPPLTRFLAASRRGHSGQRENGVEANSGQHELPPFALSCLPDPKLAHTLSIIVLISMLNAGFPSHFRSTW